MNLKELSRIFNTIIADPRYLEGIAYGKPRKGHDEGTVENHIDELMENLLSLASPEPPLISSEEFWKLKILIHVHDTFKLQGKKLTGHQVSLRHRYSHPILAKDFLGEFTDDAELLSITQYHDEGHALWQQQEKKGKYDDRRLMDALNQITNIPLYLIFTIVDGHTVSKLKDRSPRWFVNQVQVCMGSPMPRAFRILDHFGD